MQDFTNPNLKTQESDSINIRQEIERYLFHWKWFVLCGFVALFFAFLYLRYTTPQFSAESTILIKDNQKSGISDELKAVFKTAIELDQSKIIEQAAARQKYLCQGQSLNVFFPAGASKSYIHKYN